MTTQSKQLTCSPSITEAGITIPSLPLSLPFPTGYAERVWFRAANFRRDMTGTILCILHTAEGSINARIARPDLDPHLFNDWGILHADVVTTLSNGKPCAEVMRLRALTTIGCSYLELMPRTICALPNKLDEFRHLAQFIQTPELRKVLDAVFSDPTIFVPFLTRFAGAERYTYPSGLLARTVDAAKIAIGMGFQTQEEADMVLTATFLYDLGRVSDGTLMSESLRRTIGFVPHPKSSPLVGFALDPTRYDTHVSLTQILKMGFCNRYPSLHPNLKQHAVLAKIDAALRSR